MRPTSATPVPFLLGLLLAGCASSPADEKADRTLSGDALQCYREASPLLLEWQREAYLAEPWPDGQAKFLHERGLFRDREGLLFYFPGPVRNGIYTKLHPELSEPVRQAIVLEEPISGMTKEQVLAAWGRPQRIVTEGMGSLAWEYDFGERGLRHLLFRDGFLSTRSPSTVPAPRAP